MHKSQNLMVVGGLALAIFGMVYGLWYAIYDEHQTLERMGISLASSFVAMADQDIDASRQALADYGIYAAEYDREVHAHAHWITLGFLWIVIGLAFNKISIIERYRFWLAALLLGGSFAFPLGVFMQSYIPGMFSNALAYGGSIVVLLGMGVVTLGFLRTPTPGGSEVDTPE